MKKRYEDGYRDALIWAAEQGEKLLDDTSGEMMMAAMGICVLMGVITEKLESIKGD